MKHQSVYNRLRRIEGQIRGIEDMVANEKPETEILIQLEAAKSSLSSAISNLVESMLKKNSEAKIELSEHEAENLLRLIKKN